MFQWRFIYFSHIQIWQCGGEIEWVPCSRVAHVYRNHMPYGFGNIKSKIPIIQVVSRINHCRPPSWTTNSSQSCRCALQNYMRVVETWLDDEFKEYFYTREPAIKGYDFGMYMRPSWTDVLGQWGMLFILVQEKILDIQFFSNWDKL